jgi:gamma-glutamyltranspeptidase / glutathione hydrolase
MRGGDIQDQVSNQFFINHIEFGLNIQEALDVPIVETEHFPSSFYPRAARPGCINADIRIAPEVIEELRRRGHEVTLIEPHHNTMGIRIDPDSGVRMGGVCSSGDQAYAIGW